MQSSLVDDHEVFGWVVFVIIMIPFGFVARQIENSEASRRSPEAVADTHEGSSGTAVLAAAAVMLVAAAGTSIAIARAFNADEVTASIELPVSVDAWTQSGDWTSLTRPVFLGPSSEAAAYFSDSDDTVAVYVANYAVQRQGREALYFANRPTGQEGDVMDSARTAVPGPADGKYGFEEYVVAAESNRRLVWFGVLVAGRNSASSMDAKFNQLRGVLEGRADAQVLVMSTACDSAGCDSARERLERFAIVATEALYAAASTVPQ